MKNILWCLYVTYYILASYINWFLLSKKCFCYLWHGSKGKKLAKVCNPPLRGMAHLIITVLLFPSDKIPAIMVSKKDGANLLEFSKQKDNIVTIYSANKKFYFDHHKSTSSSTSDSVFFVSIPFIVLMIISLAWLLF